MFFTAPVKCRSGIRHFTAILVGFALDLVWIRVNAVAKWRLSAVKTNVVWGVKKFRRNFLTPLLFFVITSAYKDMRTHPQDHSMWSLPFYKWDFTLVSRLSAQCISETRRFYIYLRISWHSIIRFIFRGSYVRDKYGLAFKILLLKAAYTKGQFWLYVTYRQERNSNFLSFPTKLKT